MVNCETSQYRVLYHEVKNEEILFAVIRKDILDKWFHEKGKLKNNMWRMILLMSENWGWQSGERERESEHALEGWYWTNNWDGNGG